MNKQKTDMEILQEIRNLRNVELQRKQRNDIFVTKVEKLGIGEKTKNTIYRLIEERTIKNQETGEAEIDPFTQESRKELWEYFYVYKNEPVLVGIRNPGTNKEIISVGFEEKEQSSWEEQRQDIEKCLEDRQKLLKEIAKNLGISEEEIEGLSEIDLAQRIEEEETKNLEEQDENEPQELSEEQVKKIGMTGMNEVKLNSYTDSKGTTLGKVLNLDGYSKLLVVHSYKLAEVTDSEGKKGTPYHMRFAFIAQKPDGTVETIPETKLKPYKGPNKKTAEINDKEHVEVRNEDCMFEILGTNKKMVVSQKDPYGIPDVYLAQNTRDNQGNMAQKLQDKYDGTQNKDVEVRALFNANKGQYQADKMRDEMKEHEKANCDDLKIDEVDGQENSGHIHFNPDSIEQQNAIDEIVEKGKVSREYAETEFIKQLEEAENHKKEITIDEVKENIIDEINEQYRSDIYRKNSNS